MQHELWEKRNEYRIFVVKPEGKRPVVGWIILTWTSEREDGVAWIALIWPRTETVCGIEPWGSIKCCEVLEWLYTWWPLEKSSAIWR
jgi:hypothetical protein